MATEGQFSTSLTALVAAEFRAPARLKYESPERIEFQKSRERRLCGWAAQPLNRSDFPIGRVSFFAYW
jgi:hypothetical protein